MSVSVANCDKDYITLPESFIDFTADTFDSVLRCPVSPTTLAVPGLLSFIEKIIHRAQLSVHVVVISLIYIKRAKLKLPTKARGQESTAHRLFLISVLLASKYLTDQPITPQRLSELCGQVWTVEEIIKMEQAFLRLVDFQLWVSDKDIHTFIKEYRANMRPFGH